MKYKINNEIFEFLTCQIFGFYLTQCFFTSSNPFHESYKMIAEHFKKNYPDDFKKEYEFWIKNDAEIIRDFFKNEYSEVFEYNFKHWLYA